MIIKCKINCGKIDKSKLFKGKSGTYLDVTLLENRDGVDQWGNDGMIVQDVTKEERERGVKGAILGNFKIINQRHAEQPARRPTRPAPAAAPVAGDGPPDDDTTVPF